MRITGLITIELLGRFWNNAKTYISNAISGAIQNVPLIDTTFYLGAGNTVNDVAINDNKYVKNKYVNSDISITCTNEKIFFIIPITGYVMTLSGIPIPVDISQDTINGSTHYIYSSKNTYNGSFSVQLIKTN